MHRMHRIENIYKKKYLWVDLRTIEQNSRYALTLLMCMFFEYIRKIATRIQSMNIFAIHGRDIVVVRDTLNSSAVNKAPCSKYSTTKDHRNISRCVGLFGYRMPQKSSGEFLTQRQIGIE